MARALPQVVCSHCYTTLSGWRSSCPGCGCGVVPKSTPIGRRLSKTTRPIGYFDNDPEVQPYLKASSCGSTLLGLLVIGFMGFVALCILVVIFAQRSADRDLKPQDVIRKPSVPQPANPIPSQPKPRAMPAVIEPESAPAKPKPTATPTIPPAVDPVPTSVASPMHRKPWQEEREWTTTDGRKVIGSLKSWSSTKAVITVNGTDYPVDVSRLSDADQEWVRGKFK